jgi:hypothetical protein
MQKEESSPHEHRPGHERTCPSCAARSATLRSLQRAIRDGDAPLVEQEACKRRWKDVHLRNFMLDIRSIHGWRDLLAGILLSRTAIPIIQRGHGPRTTRSHGRPRHVACGTRDGAAGNRFGVNVPGRGYCFTASEDEMAIMGAGREFSANAAAFGSRKRKRHARGRTGPIGPLSASPQLS